MPPNPSVEALLHAFLPFAYVDHSHATAILALADQTTGGVFPGNHTIGEEVFGALGVVVRVKSTDDMVRLAKSFECQQPVTLHMDKNDAASAWFMRKTVSSICKNKLERRYNPLPISPSVCQLRRPVAWNGHEPLAIGDVLIASQNTFQYLRPIA